MRKRALGINYEKKSLSRFGFDLFKDEGKQRTEGFYDLLELIWVLELTIFQVIADIAEENIRCSKIDILTRHKIM